MAMGSKQRAAPLKFIHPDQTPERYGLTAIGTCMEPLISNGTVLVFDKSQEPERGDIVGLVFTRDAATVWGCSGLVKRLALSLPPPDLASGVFGAVVVEQINPPRQYVIPTADLLAVHKAIGTAESNGQGQAAFNPGKVEAWHR